MEPIFAGKLSLTDDLPQQAAVPEPRLSWYDREDLLTIEQARAQLDRMQANRIEGAPVQSARLCKTPAEQVQGMRNYVKDTYGQPQPLPEPGLSPATQRVRAEAARLGIDYDAEVTRVLHRMKGRDLAVAPGPYNRTAGPDPLKNISLQDLRMAETFAAEEIRRKYDIKLPWEE